MKLILDTHAFIWWDSDPTRLPSDALEALQDQESLVMLSVASVWEMQIKSQLGRLTLDLPLAEIVRTQTSINGIQLLPVELEHVLALDALPQHHRDPFDRILVAQATAEDAVLVSGDSKLSRYAVQLIW